MVVVADLHNIEESTIALGGRLHSSNAILVFLSLFFLTFYAIKCIEEKELHSLETPDCGKCAGFSPLLSQVTPLTLA